MAKRKKVRLKKFPIFILLVLIIGGGYLVYNNFFTKVDVEKLKETTKKVIQKEKVDIVDVNKTERDIAVMIYNHTKARPYHSGLDESYLVYEILVEGGYTRYMALYNDKDTGRIGSVRSSRHYFLDYAMENDAVYVHWGWSPQAQSDIASYGINNINGLSYENVYFYRDKSLNVSLEHTGFTDMEKINKGIKALGYSTKTDKDVLLNYSVEDVDLTEVENEIMAYNVNIPYSGITTTSYVYDPETKMYNRFVNDEAHVDYVTKEQYAFKNIITYKLKSTVLDSAGRIELDNIGSGEGYYITNGYAVPITWEKASRKAQTKYYFEDGTELKVSDGNTFIQIQPTSKTLSIS